MPGATTVTSVDIYDMSSLLAAIKGGYRPDFLFFWGHSEPRGVEGVGEGAKRREGANGRLVRPGTNGRLAPSSVTKACLSQWYPAPFEVGGVTYATAEHYMMAEKARLFRDMAAAERVLSTWRPDAAKRLGREVGGFDEETWAKHRFEIVVSGNTAKFEQHPELAAFLLDTGEKVLVEASPKDRIWGIGMAEDHPDVRRPTEWRGQNLLGFALMQVRARSRGAAGARR
jgi:hypothetical protein